MSLPQPLRHPSTYWITWVFLIFLTPLAWLLLSFITAMISIVPVAIFGESNVYVSTISGIFTAVLQFAILIIIYAGSQWLVLSRFGMGFKSWVVWSAIGITIGLLVSFLSAEIGRKYLTLNFIEDSPIGGIMIGLLFGASLGLMQSYSLQTISKNSKYWALANIIAYTCACVLFQVLWLKAVSVDDEGAGFLLYCFLPLTTLIIGAITGLFLIWPIGVFKGSPRVAS